MKKLSTVKKIQLAVLIILSAASVYLALADQQFYEQMTAHPTALSIYVLMWVVLFLSFLFMLFDFIFLSKFKNDYNNLNEIAYSDHLSGIPNRFSCDALLEKYANRDVPDSVGCIMFEITNLNDTNSELGHALGNELIKKFSVILSNSALALCFVGRNGGNKFLAVFENATQKNTELFLNRIKEKVEEHNNEDPKKSIDYEYGIALNAAEKTNRIQELVSLANSRISD